MRFDEYDRFFCFLFGSIEIFKKKKIAAAVVIMVTKKIDCERESDMIENDIRVAILIMS